MARLCSARFGPARPLDPPRARSPGDAAVVVVGFKAEQESLGSAYGPPLPFGFGVHVRFGGSGPPRRLVVILLADAAPPQPRKEGRKDAKEGGGRGRTRGMSGDAVLAPEGALTLCASRTPTPGVPVGGRRRWARRTWKMRAKSELPLSPSDRERKWLKIRAVRSCSCSPM